MQTEISQMNPGTGMNVRIFAAFLQAREINSFAFYLSRHRCGRYMKFVSRRDFRSGAKRRHRAPSFDHLVGGHLHGQRHRQAQRLRGPEVKNKLEFRGQDDWQVCRLLPFQSPAGRGG
jgi:hypothetical protein